jgi:hypothetical protein
LANQVTKDGGVITRAPEWHLWLRSGASRHRAALRWWLRHWRIHHSKLNPDNLFDVIVIVAIFEAFFRKSTAASRKPRTFPRARWGPEARLPRLFGKPTRTWSRSSNVSILFVAQ